MEHPRETTPLSVSLCLMVRDEQAKLAASLQSVADLVDKAIAVDTGWTDSMRELAAKLGARVFEFPWIDDFPAEQMRAHSVISKSACAWSQSHSAIDVTIAP